MAAFLVHHKAAAILLLSITLAAHRVSAKPGPSSEPLKVDKPFNMRMKSYNFNTTLYWDYNTTSITPYFRVEIYNYKHRNWTVVETCTDISHQHCDLSEKISEPYTYYNVQVIAFVGSKKSEYSKTEFQLVNDGIIGPPTLNASVEEKMIVVDMWLPHIPIVDGKKTISHYFKDLKYIVYYGNDTEETDDCNDVVCTAEIFISNSKIYCIFAQGISDTLPMTIEKSKEICIEIAPTDTPKQIKDIVIAVIVIVAVVVICVSLICCVFRFILKARAKVPQSLEAVVRNITTRIYMPSEQPTTYNLVSTSTVESPEEKVIFVEEAKLDMNKSAQSVSRESVDPGYQSSLTETEQNLDEGQDGRAEEESSSDKYFHADSSSNNVNDSGVTPESEKFERNAKEEPPRDIKPLTNSCGYDKAHVPLDDLIKMIRGNEIEPSTSNDC